MNRFAINGFLALGLLFAGLSVSAQEKPQRDETKAAAAQQKPQKEETKVQPPLPAGPLLRVQVVFSEYEGEKKTNSLPYTLLVPVAQEWNRTRLRIGDRVPIATGTGSNSLQYIDVGTNIDCGAKPASEGHYELQMTVERSWVEGHEEFPAETSGARLRQPNIRQFRVENSLLLRDGQTIETTFATDPSSGKVIKVEVTLNVMK